MPTGNLKQRDEKYHRALKMGGGEKVSERGMENGGRREGVARNRGRDE